MNGISQGAVMPYADIMLDCLNAKGIRTGVISNNCFKYPYNPKTTLKKYAHGSQDTFLFLLSSKFGTAATVWKMTFTEQIVLECFLFYMKEEQRMKHIFCLIKMIRIILNLNMCVFMTGGS